MRIFNGTTWPLEETESCLWFDKGQLMLGGGVGSMSECQAPASFISGVSGGILASNIPDLSLVSLDIGEPPHTVNVGQPLVESRLVLEDLELVVRKYGKQFRKRYQGLFGFYNGFCGLDAKDQFTQTWREKARDRMDLYEEIFYQSVSGPPVITHVEPSIYFYPNEAEANIRYLYFMIEELEDWCEWIPWISWEFQGEGTPLSYIPMGRWEEFVGILKASSALGVLLFKKSDVWNPQDDERLATLTAS